VDGVKFTLGLPIRRVGEDSAFGDAAVVKDIVAFADEAGFWGMTAPDHIVSPNAWAAAGGGDQWIDPFVLLAFAAAHTKHLRLITHVIVLPYRTPFEVAKALASLDHLSGGRAVLGAGSGYLKEEFAILGVPFAERGARTDESLRIIRACWESEGDIDYDGDFWSIHDARMGPRPTERIPIWIGGNSKRALRRACELGDCWAPFDIGDDDVRAMMDAAPRAVELALPLGRARQGDDSETRIAALHRTGADYIKCGFSGRTPQEWFANAHWFAEMFLTERA